MTTKTIVIGEKKVNNKKPNKIKLVQYLQSNLDFQRASRRAESYEFLELICLDYTPSFDLIFAYNNVNERDRGSLYLGKWNDGVV